MNKEIAKAIQKKEQKHTLRKWWNKNGYKVLRIIFFPIWFGYLVKEKIAKKLNARNSWSDERANEILTYYIPRCSDWDAEDEDFYFFDNGYGWSINLAKKHLKFKDRRFWKVNNGFCGGEIRDYLIEKFELEGFEKKVCDCSDSFTEIIFTKK